MEEFGYIKRGNIQGIVASQMTTHGYVLYIHSYLITTKIICGK